MIPLEAVPLLTTLVAIFGGLLILAVWSVDIG